MDLGGGENPRTTAGRGPAWEKAGKRRYYAVLAAALLLSAACLFGARQERLAERAALVSFLEHGSGEYLPRTAGEFTAVMNIYSEEWKNFSADIERGIANKADGSYFVELTKRPFKNAKMQKAWIHLEPGASRGKEPFAVMRDSDGVRFGAEMAYRNMQGDYYSEMSERSSLRFFMVMDRALVLEGYGALSLRQENKLKLIVESPLLLGGVFAGIAGFEADIQDAYNYFIESAGSTGMDMFLVDHDGTVLVSTHGVAAGEPYRDIPYSNFAEALSVCAERASQAKTLGNFIIGSGDNETFAAYTAVDAGAAGGTWFVAGLRDVGGVPFGSKWAFAIFFIWFLAVVGVLTIRSVENRTAASAANKQLLAAMPPETAVIFQKLNRRRGLYYILCMLFCVPGMIFLGLADKRYQEAKKSADAEAAQKAIARMRNIAVVCVIIGGVVLYLNILFL